MKEKIQELTELFDLMPEWSDRYNYLIELGSQMPPMPVAFKVPENRIACNSQLFFYVYYTEGICHIEAEANAPIPQGLAALLYTLCNGLTRQEIHNNFPLLKNFIQTSGLPANLSLTRGEALEEMLKIIVKLL